jgi:CxxC-x17-CxxC domain-containing protein
VEAEASPREPQPPAAPRPPRLPRDPNKAPLKPVRKVRSEHGTRVARRVVCSECGKHDVIDFAPRDLKMALCRECAFEKLGISDPDNPAHQLFPVTCVTCGKKTKVPFLPQDPNDVECADCYRGIETQQGNKTKTASRVSKKVVRVRRPESD